MILIPLEYTSLLLIPSEVATAKNAENSKQAIACFELIPANVARARSEYIATRKLIIEVLNNFISLCPTSQGASGGAFAETAVAVG